MAMFEKDDLNLNLEATELTLGLPGCTARGNKRALPNDTQENPKSAINASESTKKYDEETAPPTKAQVVGWPPVRSFRKNCFQAKKPASAADQGDQASGIYVKVSMDGAPYLRKMDLKVYKGYAELLKALEDMFKVKVGEFCERQGYSGSEFVPTYEDKDGDWMLVGDVPWE
ncbi:hypothetical protein TIFTF001_000967 [Ficus carica]|uniref:Auxin-responsive protein n=1 Tax=Ficus carica TaxID=3494 RepID=A0AA87YZH2_FICCA|nr:hypothetical protein TIFTF001_000967 [Ficus carica]